jgi:hypothetical protein
VRRVDPHTPTPSATLLVAQNRARELDSDVLAAQTTLLVAQNRARELDQEITREKNVRYSNLRPFL